jgi:hypothetical protein
MRQGNGISTLLNSEEVGVRAVRADTRLPFYTSS